MKIVVLTAAALLLASCGQGGPQAETKAAAAPSELTGPAAVGRAQFSQCAVCHSVRAGEPARIGPNLFGVYGRAAGSDDGFAYSEAMRNAGIVWTDNNLDAFLENPQGFMRGNRMAFAGERNAEKRAAIIAYLKTLQPGDD